LAAQGAHVVLAVRDVAAGKAVADEIRAAHANARVDVEALDLTSLRSIDAFADRFSGAHTRLHGLVNNAGVMNTPFGKTKDGFELQLGTNHLGHFHLTARLLDLLKATPGARVVNLSSCYHDVAQGRKGTIDFDDLNFERRKYDGWQAYAQSKLANVLHAKELARRLEGTGVLAVSVHPGWVRTRLIRNTMPTFIQNLIGFKHLLQSVGMIEPWEGAQASLHALLSPDVVRHNGAYFSQLGHYRDKTCNGGGFPLVSPNPQANDAELARRLWVESERLVQGALQRGAVAA
jgi:retinol dehydrogenase-13